MGGAGAYFILGQKSTEQPVQVEEIEELIIEEVSADDIGLVLTPSRDNKSVKMEISKISDIYSIEYEVSYEAEGKEGNVPRGVIGTVEVKDNSLEIERDILLGTCSSNVCRYDTVISDIKFVIRINYKDGKIGSVEEEVSL